MLLLDRSAHRTWDSRPLSQIRDYRASCGVALYKLRTGSTGFQRHFCSEATERLSCRKFLLKMSSPSVEDVTERLAQTKVAPQNELSFKGKGLKLDKAEDGESFIVILNFIDAVASTSERAYTPSLLLHVFYLDQ